MKNLKCKVLALCMGASVFLPGQVMAQVPFCSSDTFEVITGINNYSNDVAKIGNKFYTTNGSTTLTEFDVATGIASIISDPPFQLGETSITSLNGDLFIFGGWTGSSPSNLGFKYSISTSSWINLPNMPNSITQTSSITHNNFIYITGGTLGNTIQYFFKFNPNNNSYTTLALPSVMYTNSKLVSYNNTIYCLGGHRWTGSYSDSDKLYRYDEASNSWTLVSQMPFARTKLSATVWGDYLYVFGGSTTSPQPYASQFEYFAYDFLNNNWIISNEFVPSVVAGAVSIGDIIYLPNSQSSLKYYCGFNCSNDLTISPSFNFLQIGNTANFTATTSDANSNFTWQSDFGQGYVTLNDYGNYSGTNTNALSISNIQLANHNQPIRAISANTNCTDTSNIATIQIADTCITNVTDTTFVTITDTNVVTVYDTLLTTVTDTLIINTTLSLPAPNNENTILIYPNPASDHITIDNGNYTAMAGYSIKIENNAGQQVFQSAINQQQFYVDLSTWTGNGLYFVHLIDAQNNTVTIRKIVLQ
jgi:N-acetylneuraminic acid mutarotase